MDSLIQVIILGGLLGLVSNLHCIGMCGPIAMALPLNRANKLTIAGGITAYTIGRSFGYALLGLIVGFIGLSANLLGVLQWLSIAAGIFIIIYAWTGYVSGKTGNNFINKLLMRSMGQLMKRNKNRNTLKLLGIGFLNAFLPCGMVYVALLGAMNTGSINYSLIYMLAFGIGTLPGFIFLGALKDYFNHLTFFSKKTVLASLISLVGVFMILRGMNLGIPYISPKVEMMVAKGEKSQQKKGNNNSEDVKIEAKMSCCSSAKDECEDK
jgi:sulfite exporter TauE/SafE